MLEVATDAYGLVAASLVSMPIHALVAPSVCHVIGMFTTEVGVAQSTSPAGVVLEPNEAITAAAAAALLEEMVDRLVAEGEVAVGAELVVLGGGSFFVVDAAGDLAGDAGDAGAGATAEWLFVAVGFGEAGELLCTARR